MSLGMVQNHQDGAMEALYPGPLAESWVIRYEQLRSWDSLRFPRQLYLFWVHEIVPKKALYEL